MKYWWIVAIVVVLLIIIIGFIYFRQNPPESFISGMWEGSEAFCEEADIDKMLLYIGEKDKDSYSAYLIMTSDGDVILNKKLKIKFKMTSCKNNEYKGSVCVKAEDDDEDFDAMPEEMEMALSVDNGKMSFYKKDTKYAEMYKDNASTDLAKTI